MVVYSGLMGLSSRDGGNPSNLHRKPGILGEKKAGQDTPDGLPQRMGVLIDNCIYHRKEWVLKSKALR
jgi:hypothetical protein